MASTPSPADLPGLWDSAVCGSLLLPPDPRGVVRVDVTRSIKEDEKKAAGKNKQKTTIISVEPATGELECEFPSQAWELMGPAIELLVPSGKPVDFLHPMATTYGISAIMIMTANGPKWDGGKGVCKWTFKEFTVEPETLCPPPLLRLGSTGAEVLRWQVFLNSDVNTSKPTPAIAESGTFDSATDAATRDFQTAQSIQVDGIVGPETYGAASKFGFVPPPAGKCPSATSSPKSAEQAFIDLVNQTNVAVAGIAGATADTRTDEGILVADIIADEGAP